METDQLPIDRFNGYFRYYLNECKYSLPLRGILGVASFFYFAACLFYAVDIEDGYIPMSIIGTVIACFGICVPLFDRYEPHDILGIEGHIKFFLEIVERKPSMDSKSWHDIAITMNQFVKENKLTRTRYLFYDDKACQDYFISLIEKESYYKNRKAREKFKAKLIKKYNFKQEEICVTIPTPQMRHSNVQTSSNSNNNNSNNNGCNNRSSSVQQPSSSISSQPYYVGKYWLDLSKNPLDNKILHKSFRKARKVYEKQGEQYWNDKYPGLHIKKEEKTKKK
ncbi:similar to Saccharomyces cerevisiae YGL053W PRM8 Pheromone-regulated protein with 2 predicted transmembrane segments and an FF sequence, a motif involved in COPII binding [Maudiozyma saulgeensis]|uniref:Similar to Saccharomyces cerevisiae YGL053W PRM8 Pheromone-regulated protein with 2 predicted transmembrane segments and an FF sequence, a motif involved in COPII binding n=1 Tax=Maudiozyma saulgeensis TaxID=1789683 RepID=A0A1X7R2H8_9SACH|nr:similar to Saccharomyces cerevisiae YGL053W PRM8 Pheromone-regulated protein with 2 predicted transmembrane segments and an FF sequence, a motif involved in COPII binding [Kazachstania saulgeensis]